MPAKNPYVVRNEGEGLLQIEVVEDGLANRQSVYFMDESPTFLLRVKNIGDIPTEGSTWARMNFDDSERDYEDGTHLNLDCALDPGESTDFTYNLDMLSYQGTAAIRIDTVRVRERDNTAELSTLSGSRSRRIYTCMVYDRDYYRVNYLWPRRAQYIAAVLSVLIVLTGILQVI